MLNKNAVVVLLVIVAFFLGGFVTKKYQSNNPQPSDNKATSTVSSSWDLQTWLNSAKDKDGVVDLEKLADRSIFKEVATCRDPDNKLEITYPTDIVGYEYQKFNEGYPYYCETFVTNVWAQGIRSEIDIHIPGLGVSITERDKKDMLWVENFKNKFKTRYFSGRWTPLGYNTHAIADVGQEKFLYFDGLADGVFVGINNELKWKVFVTLIASIKPLK